MQPLSNVNHLITKTGLRNFLILSQISPNRIGCNFGNLLVFVSSFIDNYRGNGDFGTQVQLEKVAWGWVGGWQKSALFTTCFFLHPSLITPPTTLCCGFLSDPCAHGVRSLGRLLSMSVYLFETLWRPSEDCQCCQCCEDLANED